MRSRIDKKGDDLLEEKHRRRDTVTKKIENRKAFEMIMTELYSSIDKSHAGIEDARKYACAAWKATKTALKHTKTSLKQKPKVQTIATT